MRKLRGRTLGGLVAAVGAGLAAMQLVAGPVDAAPRSNGPERMETVQVAPVSEAQISAETPAEILRAGADTGVEDGYPGVIGMVREGSDTKYVHAGYGDQDAGKPADPKAKVRVGSNTKAFISTVILQLEAEGKLSLDDTVDRWLPGVVNANGNDGKKISLRQLLNQTSGLPDYLADSDVMNSYSANNEPERRWPPRTLVDIAIENAPTGKPGQKWEYSNTNYILAGMVIEAVTGNHPAVEVRTRIIEPLGLDDTTYPISDPKLYGNSMRGYFWQLFGIRDVTVSNVQAIGAAGAMVSTMDDLAIFERALLRGRLLPPAQQKELVTTAPTGDEGTEYGLGIGRWKLPCGATAWTHSGGLLGYSTTWLTSPDGDKQLLTAANEFHMALGTNGQTHLAEAVEKAYCAM